MQDILKLTAAVLPEVLEKVVKKAYECSTENSSSHVYAHLNSYSECAVPYYLSPEMHQSCLRSRDIPQLTLRTLIRKFEISILKQALIYFF